MRLAFIILVFALPQIALAGDSLYFSIGPIGVGEISNRLLLHIGGDFIRTPVPTTRGFLALCIGLLVGLVGVIISGSVVRRRRGHTLVFPQTG